jgi:hypothetical protein
MENFCCNSVTFERSMIAPCGMNCGACYAFLREKNKCCGCWLFSDPKLKSRYNCRIKNCDLLQKTTSKYCYECEIFPCQKLKHLDKRYRTKYNTGLIQNLLIIKEAGMENFIAFETKRRTCPDCGSTLSVHKANCLICQHAIMQKPLNTQLISDSANNHLKNHENF